jgi:hypothetical protein
MCLVPLIATNFDKAVNPAPKSTLKGVKELQLETKKGPTQMCGPFFQFMSRSF